MKSRHDNTRIGSGLASVMSSIRLDEALLHLRRISMFQRTRKSLQPATRHLLVGHRPGLLRVDVQDDVPRVGHALTAPLQGILPFRQTALAFSPALQQRHTPKQKSTQPTPGCDPQSIDGGAQSTCRSACPCRTEKHAGHSIGNEDVAVCVRSVQEAAAECRHACETTW
jgi:hypothetical protein